MLHPFRLAVFTSNLGKYNQIHRAISQGELSAISLFRIQAKLPVNETDSAISNANKKAILGSNLTEFPVLATDDEINIHTLKDEYQPGAKIKRIVGDNPSEADLISYYSDIIASFPNNRCVATISTYISLAQRSELLGNTKFSRDYVLELPPSRTWLAGFPLSAFNFVPEFGKRYVELTKEEQQTHEMPFRLLLIRFITKFLNIKESI